MLLWQIDEFIKYAFEHVTEDNCVYKLVDSYNSVLPVNGSYAKPELISHNVYFVAGIVDGEVRCKIAHNCDSLQCDYNEDWMMPRDALTGEVIDTEVVLKRDGNNDYAAGTLRMMVYKLRCSIAWF